MPLAHGTPESALSDVVIIPFNDVDRAIAILDQHADELACVLLDLMPHRVGLNAIGPGFLHAIRDWTRRNESLLVFDEVITLRAEYGGLQTRYGIEADITAMGKIIGGGFPIGAIAGRHEILDIMNPASGRYLFPHSGTYSANPISMTAGLAAMQHYDRAAVERLRKLDMRATQGIEEAVARTGARACVTGGSAVFRVHMKEQPPQNFREAYLSPEEQARLQTLLDHLFNAGFIMINTCTATLSDADDRGRDRRARRRDRRRI